MKIKPLKAKQTKLKNQSSKCIPLKNNHKFQIKQQFWKKISKKSHHQRWIIDILIYRISHIAKILTIEDKPNKSYLNQSRTR